MCCHAKWCPQWTLCIFCFGLTYKDYSVFLVMHIYAPFPGFLGSELSFTMLSLYTPYNLQWISSVLYLSACRKQIILWISLLVGIAITGHMFTQLILMLNWIKWSVDNILLVATRNVLCQCGNCFSFISQSKVDFGTAYILKQSQMYFTSLCFC